MSLIIERATTADLDVLAQLFDDVCDHLAANTNYPGWEKGRYPVRQVAEAALAEDSLYVARLDGCIAGTVTLNHREEEAYIHADWRIREKIAVVHTLAVHPDYFHRGIGRALMNHAIHWAKSEGSCAIHLDTHEKNTPAMALYEKLGFVFRGKIDLGFAAWGQEWYCAYELEL